MAAMLLAYATVPAKAQLGGVLTASPLDTIGQVGETIGDVTDTPLQPLAAARRDVRKLARDRLRRLALHVSENREAVEWDDHRQPAVRGEVLLLDPDPEALQIAGKAGYPVLERNSIAGLGVPFVRLGVPAGRSLAHAIRELRKALPGRTISADNLHFPAGRVGA
ncbi:MAG: peptidase S8, partial [Novosphingobium sp.]|nr:peptidase S8 [Novosphingobium sp.]